MIKMIDEINKEILNKAFELGFEFGENWLVPVNKRMRKFYPTLSGKAKIFLDKHINEMRTYSIGLVSECVQGSGSEEEAFLKLDKDQEKIIRSIKEKSPMLSDEMIDTIYSQAVYYSRK